MLDLFNAFIANPVHQKCWYEFAFTFRNKQFTFTCLPQGYSNSPAHYHKCVAAMWEKIPEKDHGFVVSYVDDILVMANTRVFALDRSSPENYCRHQIQGESSEGTDGAGEGKVHRYGTRA